MKNKLTKEEIVKIQILAQIIKEQVYLYHNFSSKSTLDMIVNLSSEITKIVSPKTSK